MQSPPFPVYLFLLGSNMFLTSKFSDTLCDRPNIMLTQKHTQKENSSVYINIYIFG
jgi:hypothetical protein